MGCQVSKQYSVENSLKQKLQKPGQQEKYNIYQKKFNTVNQEQNNSEKKQNEQNAITNNNLNIRNFIQFKDKQKNSYISTYVENQDTTKNSSKNIQQSKELQTNKQKSQGSLSINDKQNPNLKLNRTLNNLSQQNYMNTPKSLIQQLTIEQNQQTQYSKILKQTVKQKIFVNNDGFIMQQIKLQEDSQIQEENSDQEQQNQYQKEQQQLINQNISQQEFEEINQKVQKLIKKDQGIQEKQLKKLGEIVPKYIIGINYFIEKKLIQKQQGAAVPMLTQDCEDSFLYNKRRIHFKAQIIKNIQKQSIQNDYKNQSLVSVSKVDQIVKDIYEMQ